MARYYRPTVAIQKQNPEALLQTGLYSSCRGRKTGPLPSRFLLPPTNRLFHRSCLFDQTFRCRQSFPLHLAMNHRW